MTRSKRKPPYVAPDIYRFLLRKSKLGGKNNTTLKTYARASTIVPHMVGLLVSVHNGRHFVAFKIVDDMIGHKLGEFSPTRLFKGHPGSKKITVKKRA